MATADRERVALAMGRAIAHRGPDDQGVHSEPEAGLVFAFQRLAIVDLTAAGHQPMLSASGRSVMVFNGEIYNAPEIAKDLVAGGLRLRGHSDSEVVIEAFERYGVDKVLPRLVGMFAIAWYDRTTGTLVLLRDRLGKKPLYFGTIGQTFFFGSQPKAFTRHPDWRGEVDRESVAAFMRFGYVPSPRSIYAGLQALRPAERVDIVKGEIAARGLYWDVRAIAAAAQRAPMVSSCGDAKARFADLLSDAVKLRMMADVPLGTFLSGGIDSATITALMQKASGRPVKSFSIGFEEAAYDESVHAAGVARHLGTDHHTLMVGSADALAAIPQMPEYYDEPFADASQVPTYLLCKLTRQHVTVALSGDGGDELLAGYSRYRLAQEILAGIGTIPRRLRPAAAAVLERTPGALWRMVQPMVPRRYGTTPLAGRAKRLAGLLAADAEERLFQGLVGIWPDPELIVRGVRHVDDPIWSGGLAAQMPDVGRRFQMLDLLTYLPDDILVKVDRASMGVALEARCPLLDHRVVEFTLGLPANMLVRDGQTKWLLRQVLYDHVPRELVDRPKSGFMMPIGQWLRGPLRDWAEDLLDARKLAADGILAPQPIRDVWAQHLTGRVDHQHRIWCVLMFQAWKKRWLEGAAPPLTI